MRKRFSYASSTHLTSLISVVHVHLVKANPNPIPFPPKILREIALHLPHTEDVMALSLTSHAVRAALSTPTLFKARLLLQKWDIGAWQDEDDKAQSSGDWKRWIRIDYIHSKTLQLLEEASAGGLSHPPVRYPSPHPDLRDVHNTQ
jgi:hypothetical protein